MQARYDSSWVFNIRQDCQVGEQDRQRRKWAHKSTLLMKDSASITFFQTSLQWKSAFKESCRVFLQGNGTTGFPLKLKSIIFFPLNFDLKKYQNQNRAMSINKRSNANLNNRNLLIYNKIVINRTILVKNTKNLAC